MFAILFAPFGDFTLWLKHTLFKFYDDISKFSGCPNLLDFLVPREFSSAVCIS